MEKYLALDIGNVCVHLLYEEALRQFGIAAGESRPQIWKERQEMLEKGRLSDQDFLEMLSTLSVQYRDGEKLSFAECRRLFRGWIGPAMEGMAALVQEMPGYGIQPVFFSDISRMHLEDFRNLFPVAGSYPGIYSFEVGEWKPSQEMFQAFEKHYGSPVLYVDDRQTLIDAAVQHGWRAVPFTNAANLAKALGIPESQEKRPRGVEFAEGVIRKFYPVDTPLRRLLWKHSRQVCQKAVEIWEKAPLAVHNAVNREILEAGALLHDIGIQECHAPDILCMGKAPYLTHGVIGAQLLRSQGMAYEPYARICERHTGSGLTKEDILARNLPMEVRDYLPETMTEKIICLADKFFSKAGDGEEKNWEHIEKSTARFGEGPLQRLHHLRDELMPYLGE